MTRQYTYEDMLKDLEEMGLLLGLETHIVCSVDVNKPKEEEPPNE